jgi:hypothetical protein
MSKTLDSIGYCSKKELLAEIALLHKRIMSLENCDDDRLSFRLKLSTPLSGDICSMKLLRANQFLLDSLQYTKLELEQLKDNYITTIIEENDRFLVRKMISCFALKDSDETYRLLFRLVCKNGEKLWIYWSSRIEQWHFRGKPKTISFCGILIDHHTYDRQQFMPCINQCNHSPRIEKARKLKKELWDVMMLMYQGKNNIQMADELFLSVDGLKSRQKRLMNELELATISELKTFIFESSLIY